MKFEIIIMDIGTVVFIEENKNKNSYTPGSGQTFILAHINITVIFIY